MKKLTNIEFIKKALEIHGDRYDYSMTNYINYRTDVSVKCKLHGEFNQNAHNHLTGHGCPTCKALLIGNNKRSNVNEFVIGAKKTHGNIYDYSLVNYINNYTRVKIICSIHGEFEQTPNAHLVGCGCPICRESKGESEIQKTLDLHRVKYIKQMKFNGCKNIQLLPFDFYLPDYNICIEYDGRQHYEIINEWGGEKTLKGIQIRDEIKTNFCFNHNITLIRISYLDNIELILNTKLKF